MKGFFDSFRQENFPTQYGENRSAADTDVLEAGFILAFVILAFCFYLVMPALKGRAQLYVTLRVTISLIIGGVLMTSNYGLEWETAHIHSKTPYKAGTPHEIHADIGMKIGLRGVNITLVRNEKNMKHEIPITEVINYNEEFLWTWDQGRFGFGPFAGHIQQEFRRGQLMGLPLPILWIADYFTVDGEGLRFGRFYRTAGWYTHIAMWSAFPCWLLANFLFLSVIRYGALCTILLGFFQVLACILWASIRNPYDLVIPFEEAELKTKFGSSFWLTLVVGILCIIMGIVILFMELRFPDHIEAFFGIDPLTNYDEYHLTAAELEVVRRKGNHTEFDAMEMTAAGSSNHDDTQTQCVLKRRTTISQAQKSLFRKPVPVPRIVDDDDDQPMYLNVQSRIPATVAE